MAPVFLVGAGPNLAILEQVLPGLLWPEALLTVASLDFDLAEAALQ
jgi:hypothetical protein